MESSRAERSPVPRLHRSEVYGSRGPVRAVHRRGATLPLRDAERHVPEAASPEIGRTTPLFAR